jgi:DNA-binding transcriptional regulator YiaG
VRGQAVNEVPLSVYAKKKRQAGAKLYTFPTISEDVDVKSIRSKLGVTQEQFTSFGFSLSAIRHWEAHRRMPEGPARILLMVIAHNPSVLLETLHR